VSGDADAVMAAAVGAAARLAEVAAQTAPAGPDQAPAPVVLLAPAGASLDMFTSYGHRGDAFAASARALGAAS
jgi:UDP-N-acetylmuramoylalanine--D-glutamate ligase